MNEANTETQLIEPMLTQAGWEIIKSFHKQYPINAGEIRAGGIRTSILKADYILHYKNRKLAVIEAKSDELDVGEGVAQAKLYGQKLQLGTAYSTNGKEIYEICFQTGNERLVDKFPSPEELFSNHSFLSPNVL